MGISPDRTPLTWNHDPDSIVNRSSELSHLLDLQQHGWGSNLHVYGPRGSGKTFLIRRVIESAETSTCMLTCTAQNTQYRALSKLYSALTNTDLNSGYHTAQLQNRITDIIKGKELVLVLDEIDFLLEKDGGDLLYFLSRMKGRASVITISANHPSLSHVIDERAYSSYRPETLRFEPYTRDQVAKILNNRLEAAQLCNDVDQATVDHIADTTTNVRFALHWLAESVETTDQAITVDIAEFSYEDAVGGYRNQLLDEFTPHHRILVEAISQLAFDLGDDVQSGEVYKQYRELCDYFEEPPLGNRRLNDFLEHLELLGIVELERLLGGKFGRTNKIQLSEP